MADALVPSTPLFSILLSILLFCYVSSPSELGFADLGRGFGFTGWVLMEGGTEGFGEDLVRVLFDGFLEMDSVKDIF